MPWLLADVEPRREDVKLARVMMAWAGVGKLYHEHVYIYQASILLQSGVLDQKMVPGGRGPNRLPVINGTGAREARDESGVDNNLLISGW